MVSIVKMIWLATLATLVRLVRLVRLRSWLEMLARLPLGRRAGSVACWLRGWVGGCLGDELVRALHLRGHVRVQAMPAAACGAGWVGRQDARWLAGWLAG